MIGSRHHWPLVSVPGAFLGSARMFRRIVREVQVFHSFFLPSVFRVPWEFFVTVYVWHQKWGTTNKSKGQRVLGG